MTKRTDDNYQPEKATTAADLGLEAYEANLTEEAPPEEQLHVSPARDLPPVWKRPRVVRGSADAAPVGTTTLRLGGDPDKPEESTDRAHR